MFKQHNLIPSEMHAVGSGVKLIYVLDINLFVLVGKRVFICCLPGKVTDGCRVLLLFTSQGPLSDAKQRCVCRVLVFAC